MEREHKHWISERFEAAALPPIDVLDVPDDFEVMDPEPQMMLQSLLDAEIAHLLATQSDNHGPRPVP